MRSPSVRAIILFFIVTSLGVLACDLSTLGIGGAAKPQTTIVSPATGAQFNEGEEIQIQSISKDSDGVVRVELSADGAIVATDAPPILKGQTTYTLIQRWRATPGTHSLSVRAFNASGVGSDPMLISVVVAPAITQPSASPTLVVQAPIGASSPTSPQVAPTQPNVTAPTATRAPTRPAATATTIINAPPGVYATSVRVDPKDPKRGQPVRFYVSFLNTTGTAQAYRWRIRIFEPDKRNSFGDTTPLDSTLPVGVSEFASMDNWRVTGTGDCLPFFARAFSVDVNSRQESEFVKPDNSGGPAAGFQVCP